MDSNIASNEVDSIDCALDKFIKPHMDETHVMDPYFYDMQKWRVERYWNEPCDNIYKAFDSIFRLVFSKYGAIMGKSSKPQMRYEEFKCLIIDAGLVNDQLSMKEIALCFN